LVKILIEVAHFQVLRLTTSQLICCLFETTKQPWLWESPYPRRNKTSRAGVETWLLRSWSQ